MARRITYAQIKSMSASEIAKLDRKRAEELLRQFREKFRYREKAFDRAGKNVYSPALEKMQNYYERNGVQSTKSMNVNKIRSELFHIQEFFNSETGDVKGARRVMREQDARIFGTNQRGTPNRRMTIEERTKFWSVYEEFLKTYKNAEAIYGSDKIQQYLGDMTISNRRTREAGNIEMMKQLSDLNKMLRESAGKNNDFVPNVYIGRGSY